MQGSDAGQPSTVHEDYDLDDGHLPPALGAEYAPPTNNHDTSELPSECPACGGSVLVNEHDLEWVTRNSARCPYCGTRLPLPKSKEMVNLTNTHGGVSDEK